MASPLKFGLVVLAGAGLLLAAPGWAQRGGTPGHFGGGMARAPMSSAPRMAPRGMARPAPRMTGAPMISRQMAFRARTAAVVRSSRPAARASANRRAVVSYRMRRDRFGHLHRVRVVSFVGGFGYPGYYGYPYDDYGLDSLDYDTGQNSDAAAPEAAPAADQYAAGDQYPAAPAPSAAGRAAGRCWRAGCRAADSGAQGRPDRDAQCFRDYRRSAGLHHAAGSEAFVSGSGS